MRAQTDPALPELPPFWRNMGAILRYPLQGAALTLIVGFALFSAAGGDEVGTVLLLILWTVAFRYAIEVLDRTALHARQTSTVVLLREFHLRHPRHPDAPAHALLAAQLLLDREGNAEDARKLLKEVAARYPQHPLLPVLRDRLGALDALSQKLAGPH